MNGGEVLLEARGLCLRRGRRSLLDGVDLILRAGERWVLWGANGAGKTSLARVLAGLQEPDSGELRLAPELASPLPLLFQCHYLLFTLRKGCFQAGYFLLLLG